ncbi:MAG: hypothetical protein JOZ15_11605 [Acidobacteria bacterium]|nr:hypothetical protein [Acidobacteriota bacterium]
MKKQIKPIQLQRETLRRLADPALEQARGAREETNYISCFHHVTCTCTR